MEAGGMICLMPLVVNKNYTTESMQMLGIWDELR